MVNEDSPLNMTFRELSSRPYIEDYNIGVSNKFYKSLNIGVFIILLSASRCQP